VFSTPQNQFLLSCTERQQKVFLMYVKLHDTYLEPKGRVSSWNVYTHWDYKVSYPVGHNRFFTTVKIPDSSFYQQKFVVTFIFSMVQQPPVGQGLLIIEASRSHSDTLHSVGLLWTSDQPGAETSTWQHTTLTRDIHDPQDDSNPQPQETSGRRPSPWTA
jgi:hypothetical protein